MVEKVFMRGGARRTKATRSGRINKTNTMYDAILHTSRLSVPEATVSTYDRQLLSRECWTPFVPRRCLYISLGPVCLVSSRLVSSPLSLSLLSSLVVFSSPFFSLDPPRSFLSPTNRVSHEPRKILANGNYTYLFETTSAYSLLNYH